MSPPLDYTMWRQGKELRSFLGSPPVLVIRFCPIKASCSLLTPTHMHTTTGVVWLFLVRAGGVVEVSLASCALTIEHHLVPTLHQVSMQTPSVL